MEPFYWALIPCLRNHLLILQMDPLMVPMMYHQEVCCLDIHLRESLVDSPEVSLMVPMIDHHRVPCNGPTHGVFLTPDQSWNLRRCSLHTPAVSEAVLSTRDAAEKVAAGPNLSAVRRSC